MSTRLRDLDDDLGAAFRSADRDAPRPEAKAALMAALGVGAATLATASAATATAGGAASGAATTAAAGGSTAAAAKGAGMAAVLKWVVASAVVVSGGAATVHAVSSPDPSRGVPPAYVAPFQNAPTARPTAARNAESAATIAPSEEPPPTTTRAQPPMAPMAPMTPSAEVAEVAENTPLAPAHLASAQAGVTNGGAPAQPASPRLSPDPAVGRGAARADNEGAGRPTVGDEIAHLDRARSLLAQGRGAEALEAINSYRRTFPAGVLAEEAAVLEVESLASAGQHERARSFGARFVTGHPRSPLVPRVVRAIGRGREGQDPAP